MINIIENKECKLLYIALFLTMYGLCEGLQEGKVSSDILDTRKTRRYSKDGKDEDKKSKLSTAHRYDNLNHHETQASLLTSTYVRLDVL